MKAKPRRIRAAAVALTAVAAVAALGCDRDERGVPPRPGEPVDPATLARALGKDAAEVTATVDPPAAAGDLKSEAAKFTTLDECVAQHAALDPLVGDALAAIGYDTFVRDACRVLEATKAHDPRKCEPIDASSLRARCEAVVAMVEGKPDDCPYDVAGDRARGREPTCVAVAARDARLCAGEIASRRTACEALATADAKKCSGGAGAHVSDLDRRACARDVDRWRTTLEPLPPAGPALPAAKGVIEVHGAEGTADPAQPRSDVTIDVERGVVLSREPGGTRIRVGQLAELGGVPHVASPTSSTKIAFEIVLPKDPPGEARVERFELDVPGSTVSTGAAGHSAGLKATVKKMERTRGGPIEIVIDGLAGSAPGAYKVHAELTTWVRDLVGLTR